VDRRKYRPLVDPKGTSPRILRLFVMRMNSPDDFQAQLETAEKRSPVLDVGTMVSIGDGIARVYGCEACLARELLEFADGSLDLSIETGITDSRSSG
jgi:F0F1-type ATP synthase alpha subunit